MEEMQNDECRMQNQEKTDASLASSFNIHDIHDSSFPRSHRLSGKLRFAGVYDARVKVTRGPLAMYSLPNDLGHLRMGISMSRRVGTAPRRNRIKRLIRESFRSSTAQLPRGYDLVVVVRPHLPMVIQEYRKIMDEFIVKSHSRWT